MHLRLRDVAALVLATAAMLAGLAVWASARIDLGLVLGTDSDGYVRVMHVEPGSIAARSGIQSGSIVTALMTIDGSEVAHRDPEPLPEGWGEGEWQLPAEAVPEWQIDYVEVGYEEADGLFPGGASVYRRAWESRLGTGGWLMIVGAVAGALVAAAVHRGWPSRGWEADAIPIGVAVGIPLMSVPLLYAGNPLAELTALGLATGGLLPAAHAFAERHPLDRWPATLFGASVVLAATVLLLGVRANSTFGGSGEVGGDGFALLAGITLVPATAAAFAVPRPSTERADLFLLAAGPALAGLLVVASFPFPWPFFAWLAVALGWTRLRRWPFARRLARWPLASEPGVVALPSGALDAEADARDSPAKRSRWEVVRNLGALGVVGLAGAYALLSCCETWIVLVAAVLGSAVWLSVRAGLMGRAWMRAAVPLACAVATPILSAGFAVDGGASPAAVATVLTAMSALPVAHILAEHHPDRDWRRVLIGMAVGLAVTATFVSWAILGSYDTWYANSPVERVGLMSMITLVPGLIVAFSGAPGAHAGATHRLDTLAVAITPGVASTVLLAPIGPVLLGIWLLGIIVLRRFTVAPLIGLAMRTQRQRDLAVAAVEAERARLAADLHDDALQELSALVRRLDSAGDTEGAELARNVAERLRAITSDLRLPLLDDLGAGPALEWLVGRFRPLTDGEVRLERTDPLRPPAGVELAVFRVAQEALANAVKHGKPPITVRYRVDEAGAVSLSVDDEGPGIAPNAAEDALHAGHLGVANMQQRAQQIGALLDIRRWPGGGTHVTLEWRPR